MLQRTRESAGAGSDNCSLESLLIEPAQRIPRYRLLLKGIVREIDKDDKYRSVILDAIETASSIAALDEDEDTRRAAALFGLGRSIDGLPVRWDYCDCLVSTDLLNDLSSPASLIAVVISLTVSMSSTDHCPRQAARKEARRPHMAKNCSARCSYLAIAL